jgi:ATP-dependent Clp protease protease subunit
MEAILHFDGQITTYSTGMLKQAIINQMGQGAEKIRIYMSSNGGDVTSGLNTYNFLRSLTTPIAIYNFGHMDSIAAVIFLAADERYMTPYSRILLHPAVTELPGPHSAMKLAELTDGALNEAKTYTGIIIARTAGAVEALKLPPVLNAHVLLDATAAIKAGFATAVAPVENLTPSGPGVLSTVVRTVPIG